VAVHCEGGYRSAIAASLLQKLGRRDVHDMVGGYKAWLAAKLPA
jgi:rhodanese-related sulfurtransferase